MFPCTPHFLPPLQRLPHAGGGVSLLNISLAELIRSSPRRWGCFLAGRLVVALDSRLPHAGGGVSTDSPSFATASRSSPRRWGCFQRPKRKLAIKNVFPTQVGVFPSVGLFLLSPSRLPHAGGGVSVRAGMPLIFGMSSPRRWGCFFTREPAREANVVFPTQVGVFLS